MTTKQIRIMFYDEKQKEWIVDMMEVEPETEQGTSDSDGENEHSSHMNHSMAYV